MARRILLAASLAAGLVLGPAQMASAQTSQAAVNRLLTLAAASAANTRSPGLAQMLLARTVMNLLHSGATGAQIQTALTQVGQLSTSLGIAASTVLAAMQTLGDNAANTAGSQQDQASSLDPTGTLTVLSQAASTSQGVSQNAQVALISLATGGGAFAGGLAPDTASTFFRVGPYAT